MPGGIVTPLHVTVPAANVQAGEQLSANDVPVGTTSLTLAVNAAPGLLTDSVYVSVSPGAASVAETDLTISGCTWSLFVTVLLFAGVGVSVEVDAGGVRDRVRRVGDRRPSCSC